MSSDALGTHAACTHCAQPCYMTSFAAVRRLSWLASGLLLIRVQCYRQHTPNAAAQVPCTFIVFAFLPALCGSTQAGDHPRLLGKALAWVRDVTAAATVKRYETAWPLSCPFKESSVKFKLSRSSVTIREYCTPTVSIKTSATPDRSLM